MVADRHRDRDRHAALAGGAVGGAHERIDREVEIGIGHHDHVVLGAAQRLAALSGVGCGLVDVAGDRRRADEAHRGDVRLVQDRVHRLLVAVDHVEHAIGQAGIFEQLGEDQGGRRVALGRLEDEAVAAGERHWEHPHRHDGREAEGRDRGNHAERLAERMPVDPGADILGDLALEQMRPAGGGILSAALDWNQLAACAESK
jgi:hypothetical protein